MHIPCVFPGVGTRHQIQVLVALVTALLVTLSVSAATTEPLSVRWKTIGQSGPSLLATRVFFNRAVQGVDSSDFVISVTGTATGVVREVSLPGSGGGEEYYTVTVGFSGVGTVTIRLKTSGTGIVDGFGNPYTGAVGGNNESSAVFDTNMAWTGRNVGTAGTNGQSASLATAELLVQGSGADIWGTADAFYYAYWRMTGDGTFTARFKDITPTHPWAKAGIMFRETLDPGSRHAFMAATSAYGNALQARLATNGESVHVAGNPANTTPRWLRLVRSGNSFSGFESTDGTNWVLVGTQTIAMTTAIQVGLAVTSHADGQDAMAHFDNISFTGGPPPPSLRSYTEGFGTAGYPFTWGITTQLVVVHELVSGVLPAGLQFHVTGTVYGTPQAAGSTDLQIRATSPFGSTVLPVKLTVYPAPNPPAPPSNLTAIALSNSQIELTWSDNSSDELGFEIERATGGGEFVRVVTTDISVRRQVDSGLTGGTTYSYRIRAVNAGGASAYSTVATATVPVTNGPAGPGTMTAVARDATTVDLQWQNAGSGDMTWEVYRSHDNVLFSLVTRVAGGTNRFADATVNAATIYYYRVRGADAGGVSAFSNTAYVETPPLGANNWQSQDIGAVAAAGSTSESGGAVIVRGSGADIWNNADEFRFRYVRMIGDGEVVARVTALENTNGWAKAAVMFRESLEPGARHAMMCVSTEHGVAFQWRASTNGPTDTTSPMDEGPLPLWIKIVRRGNTLYGYLSRNGLDYQRGSILLGSLPDTMYAGLAATSHNDGVLCSATFDSISASGSSTQRPNQPGLPSAVALSSSQIRLTWADNSWNESGFRIERQTGTASFVQVAEVGADTTTYMDSGLAAATTYTYRVNAYNAGGPSNYSSTASATTQAASTQPIAAPSGVAAQVLAPGHIDITWTDNATNETGFAIERSLDGVNFTGIGTVAANVRIYGDYAMTGTATNITYYYRVRAFNGSGNSEYSAVATAVYPAGGPGFAPHEVGAAAPTAVTYGNGLYTVTGGGTDIWEGQDSCEFDAEPWTGDGEFVARVQTIGFTHAWAKAGLMFRENLTPQARNAFIALTAGNGIVFQTRTVAGGATSFASAGAAAPPVWLKITRQGNVFTGFRSADGSTWTVAGSATIDLPSAIHVGFAVTSHSYDTGCTARFSDVYLQGVRGAGSVPPAAPTALRAGATSPWEISLTWTDNADNEEAIELQRSTDNVAFTTVYNPGPNVVGYIDRTVNPSTTYYYRVRATNAAGASAWATTMVQTPDSVGVPPAAPSNLSAAAISESQINLQWVDNATNESGFQLERSTDGTTFTRIATPGANQVGISDTGLAATTTYYYRIRSIAGDIASSYSNIVNATTLPAGTPVWQHADVGSVGLAGSDDASGSSYVIRGSGADIWDNADGFRFLYRVMSGDCTIDAQVTTIANTDAWAKAGLMIRENLSASARNVFAMITPANGVFAQARAAPGSSTAITAGPWYATVPCWLRLVRSGATITALMSADGNTWTPIQSYTTSLPSEVYVGFAVTSHNNAALNTATFKEPYIR